MSKSTLVFVYDREQVKTIIPLIREPKDTVAYAFDPHSKRDLCEIGIGYKTLNKKELNKIFSSVTEETLSTINKLVEKTKKRFGQDSVEDYYLSVVKCRLGRSLIGGLWHLKLITIILSKEKPKKVIAVNNDNLVGKAIVAVTKSKKIKLETFEASKFALFRVNKTKTIVKSNALFGFRFIKGILISRAPSVLNILEKIRYIQRRNREFAIEKGVGKKILFIPFTYITHLKLICPVLEKLKKETNPVVVLFDNPFNEHQTIPRNTGVPLKNFEQYVDNDAEREVMGLLKSFELAKEKLNETIKDVLGKYTPSLWDIVKDDVQYLMSKRVLHKIALHKVAIRRILETEKPEIMALPGDMEMLSRITLIKARSEGIKTIIVPHYSGQLLPYPILFEKPLWDKIAVMGKVQRDSLIEKGVEADKIIVTGSPKFDDLFSKRAFISKEEICNILGVNPEKGLFVFTTQGLEDNDELIKIICRSMKEFPDKHMIIRPHPLQTGLIYKLIVKKTGVKNVTVTKNVDLWDLINSADLLFSVSSITIMDAIILNKPVITLNLSTAPNMLPYIRSGVVKSVKRSEEFIPTIHDVLENPSTTIALKANREKFLEQYVLKGNSSRNIAKAIISYDSGTSFLTLLDNTYNRVM